jgi:ABC-type lipoprotein export system ATPase subunit
MEISVTDLVVEFPDSKGSMKRVIDVPALGLESGAQMALVGSSGSGKTTLLHCLSGVVRPTAGRITFIPKDANPIELTELSEGQCDEFRARHVGYVFQTFNLLQSLTAHQNVALAAHFGGMKEAAAAKRTKELLDRMGLGHRAHAFPRTMSVGEQQRVALARALVNHPGLILADEPTASLDEANGAEVLKLLKETAAESKSTLLLVTHEGLVWRQFELVTTLKELSR